MEWIRSLMAVPMFILGLAISYMSYPVFDELITTQYANMVVMALLAKAALIIFILGMVLLGPGAVAVGLVDLDAKTALDPARFIKAFIAFSIAMFTLPVIIPWLTDFITAWLTGSSTVMDSWLGLAAKMSIYFGAFLMLYVAEIAYLFGWVGED